ncbi:MAG: ABC transporter permease [Anaerolineales bacterium]|nr:ABC transporter permease [Anaerolineales bacterium]
MSFRHLWAVTRKEIQHILRDRMTFFLVFLTPVLLLFVFSYALTVELRHIPIAVLDMDRSQVSRAFVQQITAGDDLDLYAQVNSFDEIETLLMHGEVKAALVIDASFGRDLLAMKGAPIQVIIDGTEPESGGFALDHISWRAQEYIDSALSTQIRARFPSLESLQAIDLRVRTWYNPGLEPKVSLIPGVISMMLGLPAMSVALALAHEREHGTLEQLMATPLKRIELLLGKMIPYIFVGMANVILLPLISMIWFDIPFNGSFVLFFLLSALFFFAVLSMGLIVGVFIRTQPAALALSFLVIFFPGFFLTGIFFPIISMPEIMRMEAMFLPGSHYAIITRGIFLQAVGLEVLWPYAVMLFVLGMTFTGAAALFFRKKLG